MSDFTRHPAVDVARPEGKSLPLVYDSPHSGTLYPDDFGHSVEPMALFGGEDRYVDDLVRDAPAKGITLVRALFARTYIDPNRDRAELDPLLLPEDWPDPVVAGDNSLRGFGLIFRLIGEGVPLYERRLAAAEIHHRIETYWTAYHAALDAEIDRQHAQNGIVWHIDWHSMLPIGNALSPDPGKARADFVLGDRFGTSCDPAFTDHVAALLRDLGYSTAINDPYAGAFIVSRHGRPSEGRHSLQIEINRGLYLDFETLERSEKFAALKQALGRFSDGIAALVSPEAGVRSGTRSGSAI